MYRHLLRRFTKVAPSLFPQHSAETVNGVEMMDNPREKVVYTFAGDACSLHYVKMRQFHGNGEWEAGWETWRSVKMMFDRGIDLQKFEIECYSGILKTNFYSYSSLENRISWKNRLW